jgi:hypothetical protein
MRVHLNVRILTVHDSPGDPDLRFNMGLSCKIHKELLVLKTALVETAAF